MDNIRFEAPCGLFKCISFVAAEKSLPPGAGHYRVFEVMGEITCCIAWMELYFEQKKVMIMLDLKPTREFVVKEEKEKSIESEKNES